MIVSYAIPGKERNSLPEVIDPQSHLPAKAVPPVRAVSGHVALSPPKLYLGGL